MAPLNMLQVDVQLGLICIGDVEASFVRALVAFNDMTLPDDDFSKTTRPSRRCG